KIIFQNKKGYEDYYRKHETAALTPDVWIYDVKDNSYRQLTSDEKDKREPHFSADEQAFFYTDEKSGDLNVYKRAIDGNQAEQLTHFEGFPVRSLSCSANDKLAFSWKGDIYTLTEGQAPKKLTVH